MDSWLLEKELTLKKSTLLKYTNIINAHLKPQLSDVPVKSITCDMLNDFLAICAYVISRLSGS